MFCYRCGKSLNSDNFQGLILPDGVKVPVCSDDRSCYDTIGKKRFNAKKQFEQRKAKKPRSV